MHVSFGHQYVVISEVTSHFNPSQDLKLGKALKLDDAISWNRGEFKRSLWRASLKVSVKLLIGSGEISGSGGSLEWAVGGPLIFLL